LAHTLKALYGDLVDLPILQSVETATGPLETAAPASLSALAEKIRFCQECAFHMGRSRLVFGRGDPQAAIAFVGDFPSDLDDAKGEPFNDAAGTLLHKMIVAMKIKPENTYLTTLSKCRPPQGARPELERFEHEEAHLKDQFQFLEAPFVVALGEITARRLARSEAPLATLRKQTFEWEGRKVFCTHHPRDLLHSPAKKKEAWEDLQLVMRAMGLL
jgi:DNA polymerase